MLLTIKGVHYLELQAEVCQLKTQLREEREGYTVKAEEVERRMGEVRTALEQAVRERDQLREQLDR